MSQFVEFFTNHWILSSLFVLVLLAFVVNEWVNRGFSASDVTTESAVMMINHQNAVVFDVRSESLFAEGHIINAHHLPIASLEKKMASLQKYKDKPIILVCAEGRDAPRASNLLKEKGFQVVVLQGGIQAWRAAGLPLVKS
jgi:rhodanese-related sulfurtransferase